MNKKSVVNFSCKALISILLFVFIVTILYFAQGTKLKVQDQYMNFGIKRKHKGQIEDINLTAEYEYPTEPLSLFSPVSLVGSIRNDVFFIEEKYPKLKLHLRNVSPSADKQTQLYIDHINNLTYIGKKINNDDYITESLKDSSGFVIDKKYIDKCVVNVARGKSRGVIIDEDKKLNNSYIINIGSSTNNPAAHKRSCDYNFIF